MLDRISQVDIERLGLLYFLYFETKVNILYPQFHGLSNTQTATIQ